MNSTESQSGLARLQSFTRDIAAGVTFLRQSAETADLVILLAGRLSVCRDDIRIATIDAPGSYVGEIGALLGGARTASVKAEIDSRIVWVPADQVESFFQHSPQLALKLARTLARRLKDTTGELARERARATRLDAAVRAVEAEVESLRVDAAGIDTPARLKLLVSTRLKAMLDALPDEPADEASEWL